MCNSNVCVFTLFMFIFCECFARMKLRDKESVQILHLFINIVLTIKIKIWDIFITVCLECRLGSITFWRLGLAKSFISMKIKLRMGLLFNVYNDNLHCYMCHNSCLFVCSHIYTYLYLTLTSGMSQHTLSYDNPNTFILIQHTRKEIKNKT